MKKIFFLFTFLYFLNAFAQEPEFLKIKKYQVAVLSDSIKETSGLTLFKGNLYTFNDSGNDADIFQIDANSGKILVTTKYSFGNADWEAITSSENSLFIGDFGNNLGIRENLKIYKVELSNQNTNNYNYSKKNQKFDLTSETENMDVVRFFYPEQKDFTKNNRNHDFDAESMVFIDGKIHLFTKEWVSKKTNHYVIDPEISENQPAKKIETFDVGFLVTDASYFDKKLYLIGYTQKMEVFLSIFDEDERGNFFNSSPKKYYLGQSSNIGQIEGIAVNQDGIYISGEEFKYAIFNVAPSLYFIPFEKLK